MRASKNWTKNGLRITLNSYYNLLGYRMNGKASTVYSNEAGGAAQTYRVPKGRYICYGRYILRLR